MTRLLISKGEAQLASIAVNGTVATLYTSGKAIFDPHMSQAFESARVAAKTDVQKAAKQLRDAGYTVTVRK